MEWGLTRELIRKVLSSLSYDRMLQVTFGSLISATRFKALEGQNIKDVKCPKCGSRDSWDHCKKCYGVQAPTQTKEEAWLEAMDKIMNKLCTPNPALNEKFMEVPVATHQKNSGIE